MAVKSAVDVPEAAVAAAASAVGCCCRIGSDGFRPKSFRPIQADLA